MGFKYVGLKLKKVREIVLGLGIILLMFAQNANAITITSAGTGNWNTAATWSPAQVPTSNDDVIIASGHIVTVDIANAQCASLVISAAAANNGITISSPNFLAVTGAITMNMPSSGIITSTIAVGSGRLDMGSISIPGSATASRFAQLTVSTGTINCSGNISFSGTAAQAKLTFIGAGILNIGGNLGAGGTFTKSTGIVNFNGSNAQTAAGYSYNTLKVNNSNGVSLVAAATITTLTIADVNSTATFNDGGFTVTTATTLNLNSGTYNCTAATFPWGTLNAGTGTVNYSLAGSQSIASKTYYNLGISGGGGALKTLSGAVTVSNSLNLNGGIVVTTATNVLNITNMATTAIVGTPSSTNCIKGPMSWKMPANIAADGTSYLFPIADGNGVYRQIELLNVRTGATTPVVTLTAAATGASTVDVTLESIMAPNWRIQQTSGNFTSSTIRINQSGLTSTSKIGFSSAQAGTYANAGNNNIGSSITSDAGKGPGYYAIGACSYNIPYYETFETGTTYPTSIGTKISDTWTVSTGGGSSGANYGRLALSQTDKWLFTATFTATAGKLYYMKYYAKQTTYATTKKIYLCTAQNAGSAITSTDYFNGANIGSTWTQETSNSWFCTTSGTYCFAFNITTNSTSFCGFDDIQIFETNPVPITWDGSTDTDWNTPANWDLNRVPTSSDQIIVPGAVASNNWPVSVPSGTYNEITLTNGSAGTITIGSGTAISMINNLTIASNGQPVTIANSVSIGGNLSIGATGNAATYSVNGNISAIGTCVIGNNSAGSTFNFGGKITANGNLTLGQNSSQIFNISVCDFYVPFLVAANSASGFTIYGTVNYIGAGDQIMLPNSYMGNVTMSGSGNRYQLANMDFNGNLDIADVTYYPADHNSLTWGSGNSISNNGAGIPDNSPYYGAFKSQRWQSILYVADLNGGTYGSTEMTAGDYLRSLSFYVQSKASTSAFKNFTIKVGHTDATKICQLNCAGIGNFLFEPSPSFVVFTSKDVTTTTGWNNHIFDHDFQWNGTQNILVEITWNNVPLGTTPGGTDKIRYTDGVYAEDLMISTASNSDVTSQTWGSNYNARPNLLVNYIGGVHDINIAKNWNNTTGGYVAKGNTVTFDGSTDSHAVNTQTIVTNNSDFYNATFINPNGYVISTDTCTVENTLTMTAGNFTTGSNILELGTSETSRGTLTRTSGTVIGYFKRWFAAATVSNVLFPLGTATYYRPGLLSFNVAPAAGGSVTGTHIAADAGVYNDHLSTTPLVETSDELNSILTDGYWNFSPNTLSGGEYDVELTATGYAGIVDYTKLHMLKRPDANSEWALVGTHVPTSGSNSAPVLERTGVTGFSDFVPSKPVSTLPIELVSFSASCNHGVVEIKWSTSAEINNHFFTVERSMDMENWQSVAQVNGAGNSNAIRNYLALDQTSNSLVYYRLKQTDYDSKFKYYAPVAVQSCVSDDSFVKVVVNPIKDKLELLVSGVDDQQLEVSLNNGIGEMLFLDHYMVVKGENRLFIDLSMLSPGIYLCNVKLSNGKTHVVKVVITR